jgi:ornithine cyclodeaminase/alanine dehydrogenase-like protein (mu-crystallin family)
MLLISNDDVGSALTFGDCIEAIEDVYLEAGRGASVFRPRSAIQVPHAGASSFTLASMDGVSRGAGVAAIRIRSDLSTLEDGRKTKYAGSPGNFCGLILLFDIDNAEPLAILNDGILQQMRVAATAAVAARRMARPSSSVMGILGAGGQARAHLAAYSSILPIQTVRVHSPTPRSREQFAEEMAKSTGVEVEPVAEARDVFDDSDVVSVCTNATGPTFPGGWLRPGTHLSSVRHWAEIGEDVMSRVDRVVIHQPPMDTWHILTDRDAETVEAAAEGRGAPVPADAPTLTELLSGATGRDAEDEVTYFLNNVGTGIQFAACASLALRRCREMGMGRELPTEWFLQQVSD